MRKRSLYYSVFRYYAETLGNSVAIVMRVSPFRWRYHS